MVSEPIKPQGYEEYLSNFKPCLFDSACGEPVAWGFEIVGRLDSDGFERLKQFGDLECYEQKWFLIIKHLTRTEAIERYGKVSAEEFGPRGGWRSVTFGEKKFMSKFLRGTRQV
jgi:hypothetical protein